MEITLDLVCMPSDNIVARIIEEELIIVPLVSGIGDMDDELYTMNGIGRTIWSRLDGKKSLREIADELVGEFDAAPGVIERDLLGLVAELVRRSIVVVR
jgi:hypothetical protein